MNWLQKFVAESNRIEGIIRNPETQELIAHDSFLALSQVTIADLSAFIDVIARGHLLRDRGGLNVRVGTYVAPPGGPSITNALTAILSRLGSSTAFAIHCDYEMLHPFTDGNGRSGRVLWLWCLSRYDEGEFFRAQSLGFLHTFYYQALSAHSLRR